MNKASSHTFKINYCLFSTNEINCVPFEDIPVKSPHVSPCFGLLKRALKTKSTTLRELRKVAQEEWDCPKKTAHDCIKKKSVVGNSS